MSECYPPVHPCRRSVGNRPISRRSGRSAEGAWVRFCSPRILGCRGSSPSRRSRDQRRAAPHARDQLLSEARAAAALSHPNIASVHDVLDVDGQVVIVFEYVEGETLAARLERGALPGGMALTIARSARRRAGRRARAGHHPPRSQARQHHHHSGRARQGPRLRHRPRPAGGSVAPTRRRRRPRRCSSGPSATRRLSSVWDSPWTPGRTSSRWPWCCSRC